MPPHSSAQSRIACRSTSVHELIIGSKSRADKRYRETLKRDVQGEHMVLTAQNAHLVLPQVDDLGAVGLASTS